MSRVILPALYWFLIITKCSFYLVGTFMVFFSILSGVGVSHTIILVVTNLLYFFGLGRFVVILIARWLLPEEMQDLSIWRRHRL